MSVLFPPLSTWYVWILLSISLIASAFFLGDHDGLTYYPFPSVEELERDHHDWWRSASL